MAKPTKTDETKTATTPVPPDAAQNGKPADQGEGDKNDGGGNTGKKPDSAPPAMAAKEETLYSIDALAGEFRVASWQVAALNRMMKWEAGKKVSKKDYAAALETLKKRPLGM